MAERVLAVEILRGGRFGAGSNETTGMKNYSSLSRVEVKYEIGEREFKRKTHYTKCPPTCISYQPSTVGNPARRGDRSTVAVPRVEGSGGVSSSAVDQPERTYLKTEGGI